MGPKLTKVFLSQPMNGKDDADIREKRASIMNFVEELLGPCEELKSYFGESGKFQMQPLECLGKALEIMAFADVVVFAPGWEEARGCRIEHECAVQYGKKVVDLSDGQYES